MSEADELDLAALARLGIAADSAASPRPGERALDAMSREGHITRAQVLAARSWVTRHAALCVCQRRWLRGEGCPGCGRPVGADESPPAAASTRLGPGMRLGSLELLEELGRGVAGVVYRARHDALGREIALKVVETVGNPHRHRRLLREVEALGRLSHPGIVSIHAVHEQPRGLAIEMELITGKTLARLVAEEGAFPWRKAARLVAQLARALEYAHEEDVLHRDLKPENVLIREDDGAAVITDFGVSRLTDQASSLTGAGAVVGTPLYMAPEAFMGAFGPPSDIYGLGSILHYMLCGVPRFGDAGSAPELLQRIARGEARPLDLPGAPADLARVIAHAVHAEPSRRYARAADLALDLERLLQGQSTSVSGIGRYQLPPRVLPIGLVLALGLASLTLVLLSSTVDPRTSPPPAVSVCERSLELLAAPGEGSPRERAAAASRLGAALDVAHSDHETLVAGLERSLAGGAGAQELHELRIRLHRSRGEPVRVVDLAALARSGEGRLVEETCQAVLDLGSRPPLASSEMRAAARDLRLANPDSRYARWLLGVTLCAGGDPADHDAAAQALSDAEAGRSLRAARVRQALRAVSECCAALERRVEPEDEGQAVVLALEELLSDPELKIAPAVVLGRLTVTARELLLESHALASLRPQVLATLVRVLAAGLRGLRREHRALCALAAASLDEYPKGYSLPASADLADWSEALATAGAPVLAARGLELSVRYRLEREGPAPRAVLRLLLERADRAAALTRPLPAELRSREDQQSMRIQHRLALDRSRVHEELATLAPGDERNESLRRALQAARDALGLVDRYGLIWRKDLEPDTVIRLSLLLGEYDAAAPLVPRSRVPRALGAELLRLRGQPAAAIAAAESALDDSTLDGRQRADLTAVRILALADAGRLDEARDARANLERALVADPDVLLEAWTLAAVTRVLER